MRVLIATDGSDLAIHAASEAPALLAADATFVVTTVIEPTANPDDDAGGFEGPVITPKRLQPSTARTWLTPMRCLR